LAYEKLYHKEHYPKPAISSISGKPFYIIFRKRSKVFHQHPVNEDVAAADFAQEEAVMAVVEKASVVGDHPKEGAASGH